MDQEEPSAASVISAAANKGQQVALLEHEWTVLSTLNGLSIPANGEFSEKHIWDCFNERATKVLGVEAATRPLFMYVIQLVHQLGGQQHSYVTDLIEFGEQFVDSKQRRCRYDTYKTACSMPAGVPSCKVAMIKKQYSMPADLDGCSGPSRDAPKTQ